MKNKTTNLLILVVVLAVFTFLTQFLGGNNISLDFAEDTLTVGGPHKFSFTVEYDRIAKLELVELTDAGKLISGNENRSYYWGTWENDAWGQYTLCAAKKVDTAILITTRVNELLVFNYQDDATTSDMLDMFQELLANR